MPRLSLSSFEAYLFDLDGTVYLGEELIAGADRVIAGLRAAGKKIAFLSNKPIADCASYADKLTRLGIPASPQDIVNSSAALALFLQQELPAGRVLVIGEQPLIEELQGAGIRIVEQARQAEAVVVSWDRAVTYDKLNEATQALLAGARFFATNPDVACPVPGGFLPDSGAFIAFLEAASGRKVEAVAGKPAPLMVQMALKRLGVPCQRALMVGDRLQTDVGVGKAAGCATALVLSGATSRQDLQSSSLQPDFVLDSIADLSEAAC